MCGGLAERRLDEALSSHPVPDDGDPYQHSVDILTGINVDEDQRDHEIVDFLSRSLLNQFILLSKDLRNNVYVLKIWTLNLMML
jgi:hypothetical protein